MRQITLSFICVAVMLLQGCATPHFETTQRYEPPSGEAGQACVLACNTALDTCQSECAVAWQACTVQVEPQVDEAYGQALQAYAQDLKDYRYMLERYQWNAWMDWDFAWHGGVYSPWHRFPWPAYAPLPVSPGDPPTKDAVRNGLLKSQCKDDCGCQPNYVACFKDCGGRVVTETRCVADCPEAK